jgi:hypothetical protein
MKEYFIYYVQVLNQQHKFQEKVLDLSSNKILNIDDLNTYYLTSPLFENINIKFS